MELVAGPGQSFCYLPLSFICLFLYLLFLYLSFPFLFFLYLPFSFACLFLFSYFIHSFFIWLFLCALSLFALFFKFPFLCLPFFICLGKMIDEEVDESEGKVTDTTLVVGQAKKRGLSPGERFK